MVEIVQQLKGLVGVTTEDRFNHIYSEVRRMGVQPSSYELQSPRGIDRHLVVHMDHDRQDNDLWLTANYDTYKNLPAANNNASGVVALLGVVEQVQKIRLPINLRIAFLDAGLDSDLISNKRRNPDFIPGSVLFVQRVVEEDMKLIDNFEGVIVVQAVGKGNMCVFERTGKRTNNDIGLNHRLVNHGKALGVPIVIRSHSPNADNTSFINEGFPATVISRYHDGAWHRMQTREDDISNVDSRLVNETTVFLSKFVASFRGKVI